MIIECPECGKKNVTDRLPQPDKVYRCGQCGASITFLQTTDTPRETEDFSVKHSKCDYHTMRDAVGSCASCGRPVCAECKTMLANEVYCSLCADILFSGQSKTGARKGETSAGITENTSGQGSSAVIPQEIRGWNWGAFLLNWIWGVSNSVWIALLALIPYVGFVMSIVLGVKGNKWAWQRKKWDSVEHFKRTQRTWAKWGLVLGIIMLIAIFVAVVIPNVGRFIGRGESEAAETELNNVQAAVVALMVDNELGILPNPVTIATDDMGIFPDTSICGLSKIEGPTTTALPPQRSFERMPYIRGQDKDGYILYQHDIAADGKSTNLVDYVATRYTMGTYIVDMYGTVTQVTTGFK